MMYNLILIGVIAVAVFALLVAMVKRYKRCPSDKLLVIYGKTGKKDSGEASTARVTHGGGQFVWPIIQDYAFLDLKPIAIDVNLTNALSKQNIRIDVPSTFTVAVSAQEGVRQNAAERLLGLTREQIASLAKDIIFGQMRLVIATMEIEEINADRDKFLSNIQQNLEEELQKIGLKLINVNITDITDESGYIDALGKEAAAKAVNEAKVSVSNKNREGAIGVANAEKEQRTQVAAAHATAEIGEANADQEKRINVAEAISKAEIGEADAEQRKRAAIASANAKAIEGENIAAINIANTTSEKQVAEAEATRKAVAAKNVKQAEALKESYVAQEIAEKQRALKDKASQYADTVVPAEIEKQKIEIEAEAAAEKIRRIAQGEADAQFAKMKAEADGINAILTKRAEGFAKLVEAAGGSSEKAVQMMIADNLQELIKTQVEAIKNVKIDKITVWDNGGNGSADGKTSTANFLQNFLQMVPPLKSVFEQAGAEMPSFMQGAGEKMTGENAANKETFEKIVAEKKQSKKNSDKE